MKKCDNYSNEFYRIFSYVLAIASHTVNHLSEMLDPPLLVIGCQSIAPVGFGLQTFFVCRLHVFLN